MKRTLLSTALLLFVSCHITAQTPFGKGSLTVKTVARNAVRIQYSEGSAKSDLPDWLYVRHDEVTSQDISVSIDAAQQTIKVCNQQGQPVFTATSHQLKDGEATLAFASPEDEYLFGLVIDGIIVCICKIIV